MIRLLVFLLFMVSGAGMFYLIFVHEVEHDLEFRAPARPTADITMTAVHVRQSRGEALEWELTADSAAYNESGRQAFLNSVWFQVYQSGEEEPKPVDVHGTAGRAFLDDDRQRVLLSGKARIFKDKSVAVRADVIDYFVKDGVVKARGNVEMRDKDAFAVGESLDYSIDKERVVVEVPTLYQ